MRRKSPTESKSAIFLRRQNDEEMSTKRGSQDEQANLNMILNQAVVTEPEVHEFVHDDEPMAVEYSSVHEEITHMSPVISLPEENIPKLNKGNPYCCK
jgi:hypothetical protein